MPTLTAPRVARLREFLDANNLDAYVVPSGDPHLSEIPPEYFARRAYISGFDGSAGVALVTRDRALLWTDGRYHLQAQQQLEQPTWELQKAGLPDVPDLDTWVSQNLPKGVVGVDPWVVTVAAFRKMQTAFQRNPRAPVQLRPVSENLVDIVWGEEGGRPPLSPAPAFLQPLEYTGLTVPEKLQLVAEQIAKAKADRLLVTALDDVAWLLNLRGSDVEYHPVFHAYCITDRFGKATVFVDHAKIPADVEQHLITSGVAIAPYHAISEVLSAAVPASADIPFQSDGDEKWVAYLVDPSQANHRLYEAIRSNTQASVVEGESPVTALKAVKNATELEGMKRCHIRDAAALVSYLVWIEDELSAGRTVTEVSGAARLKQFRSERDHSMGLSFESISASGPNGAVIHYRPQPATDLPITRDQLYLIDSGGQYRDGTTDVTRTVHFGAPQPKEREAYTRVLKGVISLATAVFPPTVTGHQIDSWARKALWEVGLDYLHGTGHGVGSFLNVHEGPQGIGLSPVATRLKQGHVLSIEPGYYEDGAFGIRIENLAYVKEAATPYKFKNLSFLTFEQLTVVPLDRKLIDPALLTPTEVAWVNGYHATVLEQVAPLVTERVAAWLRLACAPL